MPYPNTSVLQLGVPDEASAPKTSYVDTLTNDQLLSGSLVAVDQFAAAMTGSACFTVFCPQTGSVLDLSIGGTDQAAGIMGTEFNPLQDRVITNVVGWSSASGSNPAGVVRVDVLVQQGAVQPANFSSIFSNNTFKLAISGSSANGPVSTKTFVSGTNMVWPKGTLLQAKADATNGLGAGLSAMRGVTVQIFWKPSGSYGA